MELSIIVPVYNEEKTIGRVLESLFNQKFDKEVIVVDDGSNDKTKEVLKKYERYKGIKIFYHKMNQGKGKSIRTGISKASGNYIIIQDADLEQNPEDIQKFFPAIANGYKAVFGTRILDWGDSYNIRHSANLLFSFLTNILFKTHLTDIMSGYKMIEANLFKSLKLKSNGFGIEPEITIRVIRNNIPIKEVPISYTSRGVKEGKKIRLRDSFIIIFTIIKLFLEIKIKSLFFNVNR